MEIPEEMLKFKLLGGWPTFTAAISHNRREYRTSAKAVIADFYRRCEARDRLLSTGRQAANGANRNPASPGRGSVGSWVSPFDYARLWIQPRRLCLGAAPF